MFAPDPADLYRAGFGPVLLPVTPPDGSISPHPATPIRQKDMGKAPGVLTSFGWIPLSVYSAGCPDLVTAQLWLSWGSNAGFLVGDGRIAIDNDQGALFSGLLEQAIRDEGVEPLRRFVKHPKHHRDLFLLDVRDFVGQPLQVGNEENLFRNGIQTAKVSVLAHGKQFVCYGTHPGTRAPYVWNRELESLEDIPQISDESLERILEKLTAEAKTHGWVSGRRRSRPVSAAPVSAGLTVRGNADIDEVRFLLSLLPNRDEHTNRNPIDDYFDDYNNYVHIAYAIFGSLGDTPEAEALWLDWAHGRPQQQPPEGVWSSVVRQNPRSGVLHLTGLAQQFAPGQWPAWLLDHAPKPPKYPRWEVFRAHWSFCAIQNKYASWSGDFVVRDALNILYNDDYVESLYLERNIKLPKKLPQMHVFFSRQGDRPLIQDLTYASGDDILTWQPTAFFPYLNLWRPAVIPKIKATLNDVKPWLELIDLVLGANERERFLRWMAYVVQHPREKPNWHWLVISVQGVGKDTMIVPLEAAVGKKNTRHVHVGELVNNEFSEYLLAKLLIFDEIRQTSRLHSAHEIANKFKTMLAAPPDTLTVNCKRIRPYQIPNRHAVLMFSNEENPVYLEKNDRRVHVINRLAAQPQTPGYYDRIRAWFNGGGLERCMAFLSTYPLPATIHNEMKGQAPSTPAKIVMTAANRDSMEVEIDMLIADACSGIGEFRSLVTTAGDILGAIKGKIGRPLSHDKVGRYLLQLEQKGDDVRRARIDSKNPTWAAPVSDGKDSGRLWLLGPQAPNGTPWKDYTNKMLLEAWRNVPKQESAKILAFKKKLPPNETV